MSIPALLRSTIDLRDYPDYAGCARANAYPGAALCEYYAASGIRVAAPLGYAASVLYFYLYLRPGLSFADRQLVKLHHYFFPSAGYSTPLGVVGGIGVGLYRCAQDLAPAGLQATTKKEKADALMVAAQLAQRREAAEKTLRAEQSFASTALVALHVQADPVKEELQRLGLGEEAMSWESLLVPHGVLWTAAHSIVHDPTRYKDYHGPVVADLTPAKSSSSSSASPEMLKSSPPSTSASAPPTAASSTASLTKLQTDALVSKVATLRTSAEEDRWMSSAGRYSAYGITVMLLAWNSGNALFRLGMGLGLGVTVGGMISATRLDQMFVHM